MGFGVDRGLAEADYLFGIGGADIGIGVEVVGSGPDDGACGHQEKQGDKAKAEDRRGFGNCASSLDETQGEDDNE